jgi:tetratricopeptide (TPR) repeat protein
MAKNKGTTLGLVGCGLLTLGVLCCGGVIGGAMLGVSGVLKNSDPYVEAMVLAESNTTLENELGAPIEAGMFVTGSLEVSGAGGTADLAWSVSGPDGTANIYLEAHKTGGDWVYDSLIAYLDDTGEIVDLLGTRVFNEGTVTAASTFIAEGRSHLRSGEYEEAQYAFDQALGLDEESAPAWAGRGEASLRLGDAEGAVADLDRAAARAPEDLQTHLVLGEAHTALGAWEGCIDAYTRALLTDPDEAAAWYGRAVCFEEQGESRKALAGAREACDQDHEDACRMAIRLGGQPR